MKHNYFITALLFIIIFILCFTPIINLTGIKSVSAYPEQIRISGDFLSSSNRVYLPLIQSPFHVVNPRINAPHFTGDILYPSTAIFWFGQVTPVQNYADTRIGYNNQELYINITIFDRRLWYDNDPDPANLTSWDAVSLYLNTNGNRGNFPDIHSFRFDAQLNWWESRDRWQTVYQGNGSSWKPSPIEFHTKSGWRGNSPNDNTDDRGWKITYRIPFKNLGLSTRPPDDSIWGLAVILHDRDDPQGTSIPKKTWPPLLDPKQPDTWGQLSFGTPIYSPPESTPFGKVVIRHGLNGVKVIDAHVGGHSICGREFHPNFFDGWGEANYAGYSQINIQNQYDVADWPCFSKYYITFPIDSVPPGKKILSAKLTLYQFGNAGQGKTPPPQPSLIQISSIQEDWQENTLTWNNAPLPAENISQSWVNTIDHPVDWPGAPRQWDVSQAVAKTYAQNKPLRLVLYSADEAYHSGKYFYSSDAGMDARPTLEILWGEP